MAVDSIFNNEIKLDKAMASFEREMEIELEISCVDINAKDIGSGKKRIQKDFWYI